MALWRRYVRMSHPASLHDGRFRKGIRKRASAARGGLAGCLLAGVDRALIAPCQLAQRVYQLWRVHDLEVRAQRGSYSTSVLALKA
jgi:hypothetical protein